MLLSFRFANHKSFREEQQLNLTPVYEGSGKIAKPALPVAGVFGANASGKSNLISALAYASNLIGRSDREVEPGLYLDQLGSKRKPFRLDPQAAVEPSSYVFDLVLNDVRYTYGFILDDERIQEEWLFAYPLNRKRTIFRRTGDEFKWGEESARTVLPEVAATVVAPTALFISVTARFGSNPGRGRDAYSEVHEIYRALFSGVRRHVGESSAADAYVDSWEWLSEPARRGTVAALLRAADVGLRDVVLAPRNEFPEEDALYDGDLEPAASFRVGLWRRHGREPRFVHSGSAEGVTFGLADESKGTRQLLSLSKSAISALETGEMLLVDEIDVSLHPLLTAKLIGLFRSESINTRRAQLVFTSHDATLLGTLDGDEVLRRDEIWFTEKGSDGASSLYPLAEFKPRKEGENRPRRYLNGSYGAIPELSMQLFERALMSRNTPGRDR